MSTEYELFRLLIETQQKNERDDRIIAEQTKEIYELKEMIRAISQENKLLRGLK